MKFTHEIESDNGISFLDVNFKIDSNRLIYNWFTKPTLSGRFMNFKSAYPRNLKINMIYK